MSNPTAGLTIDSIVQLASLGLRLGAALVERRTGRSLTSMSDDDVRKAIHALRDEIPHEDDLIAEGQRRGLSHVETASGRVSGIPPAGVGTAPPMAPSSDIDAPTTGFDTGQDFDEGEEVKGE